MSAMPPDNITEPQEKTEAVLPHAAEINRLEAQADILLESGIAEMLPENEQIVKHVRRLKETARRDIIYAMETAVRQKILVSRFGAITVESLAEALSKINPDAPVMLPARPDMSDYHAHKKALAICEEPHPASPILDSWRGNFGDAAISCDTDKTWSAGKFAEKLSSQIGNIMFGYKGGEYPIHATSAIWVSETGEYAMHLVTGIDSDGSIITRTLDDYPSVTLEAYQQNESGVVALRWAEPLRGVEPPQVRDGGDGETATHHTD